jgi:hypothetical protein
MPLYNKLAQQLHYIHLVLQVACPDNFGFHLIFVILKLGNKFSLPLYLSLLVSHHFSLATNW